MMSLGTEWTSPGEGATVAELLSSLHPLHGCYDETCQEGELRSTRETLRAQTPTRRSALRLTGRPLQPYDLQRIRETPTAVRQGTSTVPTEQRRVIDGCESHVAVKEYFATPGHCVSSDGVSRWWHFPGQCEAVGCDHQCCGAAARQGTPAAPCPQMALTPREVAEQLRKIGWSEAQVAVMADSMGRLLQWAFEAGWAAARQA